MLKDFVVRKNYSFCEKFNSWQEAIEASCLPLVMNKVCDSEYANEIIECIDTYGPYIIIAPFVAMPHSTLGGNYVHETSIGFMKVEEPVIFDKNDRSKDAKLFFVLAATNNEDHLKNMVDLSTLLTTEGLINDLLNVKCPEDLIGVSDKYQL